MNYVRQQTRLTRIVLPPIGAWIHDGHGYIRWIEWRLRTELQNRPVNSLEGSMYVQAKYCGSDRRWYMYNVFTYAKLFGAVSRSYQCFKASINSRQVTINLLRLVLGRNVNGNAVKMLL